MNKNAIKKFAIEARKKLIASVSDKAGMLGITENDFQKNPLTQGADFAVYRTAVGTEITLNKQQYHQRELLVQQLESRGYEAVIEEVAYTWFNRICAIRFMEVNDYLPTRVRVLSSEKEGKNEPDLVTQAPDVDLDFTDEEREWIIEAKMNNKLDDLFKILFIKQCNKLHEILPELFEETEDYTEMLLNLSYTNEDDVIHMLVDPNDGIPEADFNVSAVDGNDVVTGQVEIIGWLYQYYNTELKDDTFAKLKKNIKIKKERIPAATQLFTPDWIVRYMVENSVGRIWIEHLRAWDSNVDEKATAERFGWKYYLPEAEQEESVNLELAEIRKDYEDLQPTDIKCIDPCMGSGHILIAMFDVLMDIYKSVGYSERDAAFDIVENNIHGLDIDKRAYQLAYFAVMMKGREYNRRFFRGRDAVKPIPKVYAIMESNDIPREHLRFFGKSLGENERNVASEQMESLLHTFVDAREYGSILNVDECDWELLERFVDELSVEGQYSLDSVGSEETQEKLQRLVQIARLLGQKYDAVVTNPPYMGISSGSAKLQEYVKKYYLAGKEDFYSAFLLKSINLTKKYGFAAMITQHTWMFLSRAEKLRKDILNYNLIGMVHLGARAFEEIAGEVVQTCTYVIKKSSQNDYMGKYCRVVDEMAQKEKEKAFLEKKNIYCFMQKRYATIPGNVMAYWIGFNFIDNFKHKSFSDIVDSRVGLDTGNNERYLRYWNEVNINKIYFDCDSIEKMHSNSRKKYVPHTKGGLYKKWYGNFEYVIAFDKQNYNELLNSGNHLPSRQFYFKEGLSWTRVSSKFAVRFSPRGMVFNSACPTVFCETLWIKYSLALLNSCIVRYYAELLSPTINFQAGDIGKIPYIKNIDVLDVINKMTDQNIQIVKDEWDSEETSWDFMQHPLVTIAKKTTYKTNGIPSYRVGDAFFWWEDVCNMRFAQLKSNEEELNRIFIDIYGLQDELTPDVEDKDITVRKADLGRDIRSFISYAVGCMFGRYSIYKEGLCYAGGEWNRNDFGFYASQCFDDGNYPKKLYQNGWFMPDDDNIIPITDEEYFPDDIVTRFVEFVKTVYGEDTLEENL
ncbi:MAG: BREX-1 system adenine-specific DNA-methyltransferase PglX, partial [Ruminococcus flavefaciens]|nr:BREX-1 system adenine-specific DNA-methyltransferase PglX [Ruminococcus flavefaciens]